MGEKLTKAQRTSLVYIEKSGPGTLPLTKGGRVKAGDAQLVALKHLELLNRLRPGPPMYEITRSGRAALQSQEPTNG